MAENMFMTPHAGPSQLRLNINDIIDGLPDDKDYGENEMSECIGGGTPSEANISGVSSLISQNDPDIEQKKKAYVQITEQPQPKALRFRYSCEGRSAGSIPGIYSTVENKTFPTIKVMNYKGPAMVVVSCVTVDTPYRPHPHNLVGKEIYRKGICTVAIDSETMECSFSNLGIQCVKRKEVEQSLNLRKELLVDPFSTGFGHKNQPQSIDLNTVRLCFQVFLNCGKEGGTPFPLKPVVSDPIYDKKATSDLNICKLSDCTSCVTGGKEIILLCDKVTKEDIQIRFFEVKNGHTEWQALADFQASDVHRQYAITFRTPKYKDIEVDHSVEVFIQLVKPSDNSTSEVRRFEYLPLDTDRLYTMNKRKKGNDSINQYFVDIRSRQAIGAVGTIDGHSSVSPRSMKVASRGTRDNVKVEPPDSFALSSSPESRGMRTVTVKPPISPQHNGGGLMFQNISPLPTPHPSIQAHLQSHAYYAPTSVPNYRPVMSVPVHSPQNHFYQAPPALPVDPSQSPYSPENPPGTSPFPMDILENAAAAGTDMELMEAPAIPPSCIFNPKPAVDSFGTLPLPDLGFMNSSDLNVDSVNNLSASLSCSLNLGDGPLNPLDKKGLSDEDKRSLNTPTSDNFFANIPANANEQMRSEEVFMNSAKDPQKTFAVVQ